MPANTKLIIRNTGLLYVRMIVTMLIGLFSVRIVLQALGEVDYGVYNVVAGVVTMMAFLNNALSSSTQRFLSYELETGSIARLKSIFSTSLTLYVLLCLLIIVLAETVGLWFVNTQLNIPTERMRAANWIYQFSIISFVFSILSAPYNACVISHERMDFYAYVSIGEAVLKLALIYLLLVFTGDKLIIYGFFLMILSFLLWICYFIYCRFHFEESEWSLRIDKSLTKEISSFTGWGVWGAVSNIFKNQGINIVLNISFGVIVNTARGLAYQVDAAINTLVQNFYSAVKPQLIKSYSAGQVKEMMDLMTLATRLGYFLMLAVSSIFFFEIEYIYSLWLGNIPPPHTTTFTKLVLIGNLFTVLAQPLVMIIHASGKVARYQFWSGIIWMMVLPISYLLLRIVHDSNIPFIVIVIASIAYWVLTTIQCKNIVSMPIREYGKLVAHLIPTTICTLFASAASSYLLPTSLLSLFLVAILTIVVSAISIYLFGLYPHEKELLIGWVKHHCFR